MELLDLTALQRDLLYVMAREDHQSTPAIRAELDEYYPSNVADAQLYPALRRLMETKLIKKDDFDERTDAYGLAEQGRDALNTHRGWKYHQGE